MRRQKKTCPITEAGIRFVDYKDERFLARFITENEPSERRRCPPPASAGERHQEGALPRVASVHAWCESVS
jgi:ribosomal protein S18